MAAVNDSGSISTEHRAVTATIEVDGDILTVDSATPGSATRSNGVQVGIPERIGQEALDEVARKLSLSEVPVQR